MDTNNDTTNEETSTPVIPARNEPPTAVVLPERTTLVLPSTNELTKVVLPDFTTIDGIKMEVALFNKLTLVNLCTKGTSGYWKGILSLPNNNKKR
jgi:hypothetical protein